MAPTKKIVLVTGANSGLGFHASLHIAKQDNYHLIFTGRDATRIHDAAEKVRAAASPSTVVEEALLDLGSLRGVEEFCEKLLKREDIPTIAAILCNAGIHITDKRSTKDGLELTFGVNHLGHFLLATLLRERTQRLVMISSETHDPEEKTPSPAPNVSDLEQLAFGYEPFNGHVAYTTSKLCNLLFMSEWIRRYPNGAECISYTPGFTPDTALGRDMEFDLDQLLAMCKEHNVPISTSEISGTIMGRLVVEDWAQNGWKSGQYIKVDHVYHPSTLARDTALAEALWIKSEELVQRLLVAKK